MEMSVNCIRGFFQAFIHGSFSNRHSFQLLGLLIVDILILGVAYKFKPFFRNILTFTLTFVYYIVFLIFDIFLIIYSNLNLPDFDY